MSVDSGLQGSSLASVLVPPTTTDQPGTSEPARSFAGRGRRDPDHTSVTWAVDRMGFSILEEQFAAPSVSTGTEPADPSRASVEVTSAVRELSAVVPAFARHLRSPDLFDMAKHSTARFVSRSVQDVSGGRAEIPGGLTLEEVARPLILSAAFIGAGIDPTSCSPKFGFSAASLTRRSAFDLGSAVPTVSDAGSIPRPRP